MITNNIFSTIANQDKKSYITFAQKQEFIHDPEQIIFQPLQKQAELMQDVGQIIFATFAKKTPELMHGVKQNILRICN